MRSGLASGIVCGVEEPKVDIGLLVDIGTTIIRETGLDDQIRNLFGVGDDEEVDPAITCTQEIDPNYTRTTTCSNGLSKTEACVEDIDPVTGASSLSCTEII